MLVTYLNLSFISIAYLVYSQEKYGVVTPTVQIAYNGSRVEILCFSKKKPRFYYNDLSIKEKYQVGNRLVFKKVKLNQSGEYFCHGFDNEGTFKTSAVIKVGGIM